MQFNPSNPTVYGIQLRMVPGDPLYGVEVWRGSDSSAPGTPPASSFYAALITLNVPAAGQDYLDVLPLDGFKRYYQARQVSFTNPNDAGPFTAATTGHTPSALGQNTVSSLISQPSVYPIVRGTPMADGSYAALARTGDGSQLSSGVVAYDGVSARVIAKGYLTGTARNGAAVSFPLNFDTVPLVVIQGGLLSQPTSVWSLTGATSGTLAFLSSQAVYQDVSALGLNVAGFTMRARLRQKAVQTQHDEFFPSNNSLVAVGDTTVDTTLSAPSNTDTYTVGFRVFVQGHNTAPGFTGSVTYTVAIDSSTGAGFVERASAPYAVSLPATTTVQSDTWDVTTPITVAGMTSSGQIRVRLKSIVNAGKFAVADTSASFVHGYSSSGGDSTSGVKYFTAADQFASMTPDVGDYMTWQAIQVS